MSTNPIQLVPRDTYPLLRRAGGPARREVLWLKEEQRCHWCRMPTRLCQEAVADQATTEHIIPLVRGGTNNPSNLTSACLLCNARRAYEDQTGRPEGSLIGQFPITNAQKRQFGITVNAPAPPKPRNNALTGDEKKAILGGTWNKPTSALTTMEGQRNEALKRIGVLTSELNAAKTELGIMHKIVDDQEKDLKAMTVGKLIRKRIAEWLIK